MDTIIKQKITKKMKLFLMGAHREFACSLRLRIGGAHVSRPAAKRYASSRLSSLDYSLRFPSRLISRSPLVRFPATSVAIIKIIQNFLDYFYYGCPSGIGPEITGPQPAVLPLHHGHHIILINLRIIFYYHNDGRKNCNRNQN